MKDIFICPKGDMLNNWEKAFPNALVATSLQALPANEPALFWVHANANDKVWLEQVMTELEQKFTMAKIVVLANTPNQSDAVAVMARRCSGYCHAYSSASTLQELKTVVIHGGLWLGQDLLKTLIGATKTVVHNSSANVAHALNLLSSREKQVALDAAEGFSNKEIARSLAITERTVKAHMSAILEKLGVKDRLQLALVLNEKTSESQRPLGREAGNKVPPLNGKTAVKYPLHSSVTDKVEMLA